ncbi:MAG: phosphoribosyltransferase family protein [Kineosporiaceae bacterium]
MTFIDRQDAGRRLAERLTSLRGQDVVVLGLPRGGVPVAYEVARALGAPLDVIVVRKLGVPYMPEFAMGAVGEGGVRIVDDRIVADARIDPAALRSVVAREQAEVDRRLALLRAGSPALPLSGRIALLVDDGIATGATAMAACQVARAHGARQVILAAPVAPQDRVPALLEVADDVVCVEEPENFRAIGYFYDDFSPTPEEDVVALLRRRAAELRARDEEVAIPAGSAMLHGHLSVPSGAAGIVVFVHGSGSSRHSPRNRYVAGVLERAGLGTVLFDLLTPSEEHERANVFDIGLLARRLEAATTWLRAQPQGGQARLGYFGASTGAAAALRAAAEPHSRIAAVVSRGGRPDLAADRLGAVRAPTLLVVGGADQAVLELNRRALELLRCERSLVVVPGATHLFEEPGALEEVARVAGEWFLAHL